MWLMVQFTDGYKQHKNYTNDNTGTDLITITSNTSDDNVEFVIANAPTTIATEQRNVDVGTPTSPQLQTATITINNDDCDEAVYDFVSTRL
jgi:hypothetical protein